VEEADEELLDAAVDVMIEGIVFVVRVVNARVWRELVFVFVESNGVNECDREKRETVTKLRRVKGYDFGEFLRMLADCALDVH